MRKRVLIVEDLTTLSIAYADQVQKAGYEAVVVQTASGALEHMAREEDLAAVLLDLQLPDSDGLALLRERPELLARYPVIVVTADESLSRAVEAMRLGAFDYLVKPVSGGRLIAAIDSAVTTNAASSRRSLDSGKRLSGAAPGFLGNSPQMREVYRQIDLVAGSRATVLITGETGTGKEVCAEAIHRQSGRGEGPFVAINCGAIPGNLLESELFGHVKGAFTGATSNRTGAAQSADGGTLFLDETCDMPLDLQVKLLRFLQTGTIRRIGSNRNEKVDVRIVCATNRDPAREVAAGRFREDLYYRLAVIPIWMPPLREREGDIRLLAEAFLARFADEVGKSFNPLTPAHFAALEAYHWPGNVRELQNVFLRATLLNVGPELPHDAIPVAHRGSGAPNSAESLPSRVQPDQSPHLASGPERRRQLVQALSGLTFAEIERIAIEAAIDAARGNLPAAARALGISASTIYRKRLTWQ